MDILNRTVEPLPIDLARYVTSFDNGELKIAHLDGVDWVDAPKPPRRHKCWPQTKGHSRWVHPVKRCACGAISEDGLHWLDRNSR